MNPLCLESDFRDFYDHAFDQTGKVFFRHAAPPAGYDKKEQFELLKSHFNLKTVVNGLAMPLAMLADYYHPGRPLVVYDDPYGHAGQGKRLLSLAELEGEKLGLYGSLFIPTTNDPYNRSVFYKWQFIGHHRFKLRIEGKGWLGNTDAVECEVIDYDYLPQTFAPLYSIDFVKDYRGGELEAIDLNMAPGLTGTGLKDLISAREVVQAIKDWLAEGYVRYDQHKWIKLNGDDSIALVPPELRQRHFASPPPPPDCQRL